MAAQEEVGMAARGPRDSYRGGEGVATQEGERRGMATQEGVRREMAAQEGGGMATQEGVGWLPKKG